MNSSIFVLLCVPLQLCEDLFSRVSKNQSAQLSYSVEVSPGLGRGLGGEPRCPLGREEASRAIKTSAVSGVRQPGIYSRLYRLVTVALGKRFLSRLLSMFI